MLLANVKQKIGIRDAQKYITETSVNNCISNPMVHAKIIKNILIHLYDQGYNLQLDPYGEMSSQLRQYFNTNSWLLGGITTYL